MEGGRRLKEQEEKREGRLAKRKGRRGKEEGREGKKENMCLAIIRAIPGKTRALEK